MPKEKTPLDKMQYLFNDVLEDLAQTTRRAWDEMPATDYISKGILENRLEAKLTAYRILFENAKEAAASLQPKELEPEAAPLLVACDYCDGNGSTEVEGFAGLSLPCIKCDGSGKVVKEPVQAAPYSPKDYEDAKRQGLDLDSWEDYETFYGLGEDPEEGGAL